MMEAKDYEKIIEDLKKEIETEKRKISYFQKYKQRLKISIITHIIIICIFLPILIIFNK
ncbi:MULTISPECIES: hypothetical protein [unclassified Spiroplasma]|uniref:hypothetical protein n=1 Tax=unclassified Spiroplasma TaxID=2637901 RepID=UPI0030D551F6